MCSATGTKFTSRWHYGVKNYALKKIPGNTIPKHSHTFHIHCMILGFATTSLATLFQCLTALSVEKLSLTSNLNIPFMRMIQVGKLEGHTESRQEQYTWSKMDTKAGKLNCWTNWFLQHLQQQVSRFISNRQIIYYLIIIIYYLHIIYYLLLKYYYLLLKGLFQPADVCKSLLKQLTKTQLNVQVKKLLTRFPQKKMLQNKCK